MCRVGGAGAGQLEQRAGELDGDLAAEGLGCGDVGRTLLIGLEPRPRAGTDVAGATATAQAAPEAVAAQSQALKGTFKLTLGKLVGGKATCSYFRMIYPGGSVKGGKFFDNPDSTASDKSYTPVRPGRDGGLVTGSFQAFTGFTGYWHLAETFQPR